MVISAPSCICHGESPGVATVTGPLLVYCTEAVVQFFFITAVELHVRSCVGFFTRVRCSDNPP